MSSENVLNDMVQKQIKIDLDSDKLVIRGDSEIFVELDEPKLNIGKLYESVFLNIDEPTAILVEVNSAIASLPKAKEIAGSIKTIIDEASTAINSELPDIIASLDDEVMLDESEHDEYLPEDNDIDISELF